MHLCLNINYQEINFCNTDSNVSIYIYALHSAQYIGCPSHTHTHTHTHIFFSSSCSFSLLSKLQVAGDWWFILLCRGVERQRGRAGRGERSCAQLQPACPSIRHWRRDGPAVVYIPNHHKSTDLWFYCSCLFPRLQLRPFSIWLRCTWPVSTVLKQFTYCDSP